MVIQDPGGVQVTGGEEARACRSRRGRELRSSGRPGSIWNSRDPGGSTHELLWNKGTLDD